MSFKPRIPVAKKAGGEAEGLGIEEMDSTVKIEGGDAGGDAGGGGEEGVMVDVPRPIEDRLQSLKPSKDVTLGGVAKVSHPSPPPSAHYRYTTIYSVTIPLLCHCCSWPAGFGIWISPGFRCSFSFFIFYFFFLGAGVDQVPAYCSCCEEEEDSKGCPPRDRYQGQDSSQKLFFSIRIHLTLFLSLSLSL